MLKAVAFFVVVEVCVRACLDVGHRLSGTRRLHIGPDGSITCNVYNYKHIYNIDRGILDVDRHLASFFFVSLLNCFHLRIELEINLSSKSMQRGIYSARARARLSQNGQRHSPIIRLINRGPALLSVHTPPIHTPPPRIRSRAIKVKRALQKKALTLQTTKNVQLPRGAPTAHPTYGRQCRPTAQQQQQQRAVPTGGASASYLKASRTEARHGAFTPSFSMASRRANCRS